MLESQSASYKDLTDEQVLGIMPFNFQGMSGVCKIVGMHSEDVFDIVTTFDICTLLRPCLVEHNGTDKRIMFHAMSNDCTGSITVKLVCRLSDVIISKSNSARRKLAKALFQNIISQVDNIVSFAITSQDCNVYDVSLTVDGQSVNKLMTDYNHPKVGAVAWVYKKH